LGKHEVSGKIYSKFPVRTRGGLEFGQLFKPLTVPTKLWS